MTHLIETKYHGPSNTRGSRIIARTYAGSVTFGYDDALNSEENHTEAARKLAVKLGWSGTWIMGVKLDQTGYTFSKEGNCALVIEGGAA